MTIGAGIAIAGVWIFSGLLWHSKAVSEVAAVISTFIALAVTLWLK